MSLTGWTVKNVPNTLLFANSSDLWAIFFLTIIEKVLYISQIQFLRIESIEVKLVRHKQTETNFKYQSLIFAQSQISALVFYLTYWECFDIDVCVLSGRRISNFLPSQGWGKFWDTLVKVNLFIQKTDQPISRVCQFIGIIVSIDQLHIIGIKCMTHIIDKVIDLRFFNKDFVRPFIKQLVKVLGFVQTQCRPKTGASIIRGHKHYFRRFVTVLDSLSSLIYWLLT